MTTTSVAIAIAMGVLCQSSRPGGSVYEFEAPVRLHVDGESVRVESPGYASPCWADVDGDGDKDLLVGQFKDGKIRVYENDGDGKLAEGKWLTAGGQIATVPGVW